jgi:class 3 adenylate cyclase
VNCSACRSVLEINDTFCKVCGASVKRDLCPTCHLPNSPGASFCVHCGSRLFQTGAIDARHTDLQPSNERKFVTLLCADLLRSTDLIEGLDPEEAIALLEPALAAMRAAIRQFRGIVSKELGDGLVALFGAPVADDGHAILACHAALELVRGVELIEVPKTQVRVGLHSGYVVTHTINGDFSSIYEAGGPAAHLVNRIEQSAEPGHIHVSESCRELAEGYLKFLPLAPRRLKGFSNPVPLYRLTGVSGLLRWHVREARGTSNL